MEDSLFFNRFISRSCPVVLILYGLIMSRSISLNLNITTTRFMSDQEDIFFSLSNLVVLDKGMLVFKECFTSGSSLRMSLLLIPALAKCFPFAITMLDNESMSMRVTYHLQLDYVLMIHISIFPLYSFHVFDVFY